MLMPTNFTEKGQYAFDIALKHFKHRMFSAADLSAVAGEKIAAATLNGIVNRGYMIKEAGTPVKFGFVEDIDDLIAMDAADEKKGPTNAKGNQAKAAKKNEFYTLMSDVENEIFKYRRQFLGKSILCNCNDGLNSNFIKYFALNFDSFGLERVVGITYVPEGHAKKYIITQPPSIDENGQLDFHDIEIVDLQGNGSFDSDESIAELEQCDIVITNPPFSEFNRFVDFLFAHNKKFLILGNNTSINLKNVFSYFKEGKMRYGYTTNTTMSFTMPDEYESDTLNKSGKKVGKVPSISWYTNLKTTKMDEPTILTATYYTSTNKRETYPKCDGTDIICIDRVANIPKDYEGVMAVPITYVTKHCPDQFELIANSSFSDTDHYGCGSLYVDGEKKYARVLIKRKSMDESYLY